MSLTGGSDGEETALNCTHLRLRSKKDLHAPGRLTTAGCSQFPPRSFPSPPPPLSPPAAVKTVPSVLQRGFQAHSDSSFHHHTLKSITGRLPRELDPPEKGLVNQLLRSGQSWKSSKPQGLFFQHTHGSPKRTCEAAYSFHFSLS